MVGSLKEDGVSKQLEIFVVFRFCFRVFFGFRSFNFY